ncbi:MAG: FAD-dependent monooxygenase, partial [Spongiibacter sp.]
AFAQSLTRHFEGRLGEVLACSKRFSFPLRQRHAVDYVKDGIVLVGDAAHTIHPLAGQGINLGFADAQALADELKRALRRGLMLSDNVALARYQRRRKGDNLAMMAAMEGFQHLFESPAMPLRLARNLGMSLLDRAVPLKRQIIARAMGLPVL